MYFNTVMHPDRFVYRGSRLLTRYSNEPQWTRFCTRRSRCSMLYRSFAGLCSAGFVPPHSQPNPIRRKTNVADLHSQFDDCMPLPFRLASNPHAYGYLSFLCLLMALISFQEFVPPHALSLAAQFGGETTSRVSYARNARQRTCSSFVY